MTPQKFFFVSLVKSSSAWCMQLQISCPVDPSPATSHVNKSMCHQSVQQKYKRRHFRQVLFPSRQNIQEPWSGVISPGKYSCVADTCQRDLIIFLARARAGPSSKYWPILKPRPRLIPLPSFAQRYLLVANSNHRWWAPGSAVVSAPFDATAEKVICSPSTGTLYMGDPRVLN